MGYYLFVHHIHLIYSELVLLVGLYRKRTNNEEMVQVTKGTTTQENEKKKKKKPKPNRTKTRIQRRSMKGVRK